MSKLGLVAVLLASVVTVPTTSHRYIDTVTVGSETSQYSSSTYIDQDDIDVSPNHTVSIHEKEVATDSYGMIATIDDTSYYIYKSDDTIDNSELFTAMNTTKSEFSTSKAQSCIGKADVDEKFYKLYIKYPWKVAATNGIVQADGYTVLYNTYDLQNNSRVWALSEANKNIGNVSGTITGVEDGATYNKNKTVKVKSSVAVKSFKVKGTEVSSNSYKTSKDGVYKVTAKFTDGNKTVTEKVTFTIDTKAPTIKGVKNKKTYTSPVTIEVTDKTSGVASVTLNGKKIKSSKEIKKAGKYTLEATDKAGNTKTITFTVKKSK
jgi:hypothetical protein